MLIKFNQFQSLSSVTKHKPKIDEYSVKYFNKLMESRDMILKVFPVDQKSKSYLELKKAESKAADAIESTGYVAKILDYESYLVELMIKVDENMYNEAVSKCGDKEVTGAYDEVGNIMPGGVWIYLREKLKKKIREKEGEAIEEKKDE